MVAARGTEYILLRRMVNILLSTRCLPEMSVDGVWWRCAGGSNRSSLDRMSSLWQTKSSGHRVT